MFLAPSKFRKYELTSGNLDDQFSVWSQMHSDGPVVYSRIPILGKTWLTTKWQSSNDMLRNQDLFCRDPRNAGKKNLPGVAWWIPKRFMTVAKNLMAFDGEQHRRLRSLVDQAFLRTAVDEMRTSITRLTDQLLDDFEQKIRVSRTGSANFVPEFARTLPLTVIMEMLGLPPADRPSFKKWFSAMSNVSSLIDIYRVIPGFTKVLKYLDKQFVKVKKNPRPGLISELVQIQLGGDRLTHDELKSMVFLLLVAGHETTVHLISNSVLALLDHPDQLNWLKSDWKLSSGAVDEVLRYTSPVQISKPRFVSRDTEFYGCQLKRGELITAVLAASNMDAEKFDNPNSFDILRFPNPHMTFGAGVHICLGLKLAKVETEIALQRLFTRFPTLSIADTSKVVIGKRLGMRTIKNLPLRLE